MRPALLRCQYPYEQIGIPVRLWCGAPRPGGLPPKIGLVDTGACNVGLPAMYLRALDPWLYDAYLNGCRVVAPLLRRLAAVADPRQRPSIVQEFLQFDPGVAAFGAGHPGMTLHVLEGVTGQSVAVWTNRVRIAFGDGDCWHPTDPLWCFIHCGIDVIVGRLALRDLDIHLVGDTPNRRTMLNFFRARNCWFTPFGAGLPKGGSAAP